MMPIMEDMHSRTRTNRPLLPCLGAAALAASAVGCSAQEAGSEGVSVITSVYALDWLAQEVTSGEVSLTLLTDPGTDPHDLELTPRQIGEITETDLLFYIRGMQPAVDDAAEQHAGERGLDAADLVPLREVEEAYGGGTDPHVWLDPERMTVLAGGFAERLAEADPDDADLYRENAAAVTEELEAIDEEYAEGLADCEQQTFVVNHAAFGYLADRYGLEQIGISGIEPDSEPSPARIARVADLVEETGVTTVFTETIASPRVAEVLAEETGVETDVLDPLEGVTERSPADDYPSIMRANLDSLTEALECS